MTRGAMASVADRVALDRLALSPRCGFASILAGNLLSEDEQWAKLARLLEAARAFWGDT